MLGVSRLLGKRGTCPRARVGAVIEKDGRILSTGYNGSLPGEPHCDDVGCDMQGGHCVRTVHAEANAICFAARHGINLNGSTLYTTGWLGGCCPNCTKLAYSAGIKEIVTEES
jgi:dCMP deaminase